MKIALRALVFVMVLAWGTSQALADGNPFPPLPPPKGGSAVVKLPPVVILTLWFSVFRTQRL